MLPTNALGLTLLNVNAPLTRARIRSWPSLAGEHGHAADVAESRRPDWAGAPGWGGRPAHALTRAHRPLRPQTDPYAGRGASVHRAHLVAAHRGRCADAR